MKDSRDTAIEHKKRKEQDIYYTLLLNYIDCLVYFICSIASLLSQR